MHLIIIFYKKKKKILQIVTNMNWIILLFDLIKTFTCHLKTQTKLYPKNIIEFNLIYKQQQKSKNNIINDFLKYFSLK